MITLSDKIIHMYTVVLKTNGTNMILRIKCHKVQAHRTLNSGSEMVEAKNVSGAYMLLRRLQPDLAPPPPKIFLGLFPPPPPLEVQYAAEQAGLRPAWSAVYWTSEGGAKPKKIF